MYSSQLTRIHAVLTSTIVQSLLRLHPNELTGRFASVPNEWTEWQSWSRDVDKGWLELAHCYMVGTQLSSMPVALRDLLDTLRQTQLTRETVVLDIPVLKATGMSPKKAHEVSRLVAYVLEVIKVNNWDPAALRIVDVGAGQGYLTRALKLQLPMTRILALDADEAQTIGAQRWESRLLAPPSARSHPISHETIHITPERLLEAIENWISTKPGNEEHQEIPVLLVGLHVCGSLALDIVRMLSRSNGGSKTWKIVATIVVGCCYNLMNPGDFPLSKHMKDLLPVIDLPISAYHLAAQIPTQWLISLSPPIPAPSVELALRKVAWRALLGKKLQPPQNKSNRTNVKSEPIIHQTPGRQLPWSRLPAVKTHNCDFNEVGTGATPGMRKLGRLKDSVYQDWGTFINVAGKKMGVDFENTITDTERDVGLERFLEVVHTIRCLVGPTVESAIILDRMVWIEEILCSQEYRDMQAKLVNLFDQATGSGRNIAIVVAPSIPSL